MTLYGFNQWLGVTTGTRTAYGSWGTPDSAFNLTSINCQRSIERQDDLDEFTGYEEDSSSGTSRVLAESVSVEVGGRATPHAIATFGYACLGTYSTGTAGTLGTSATGYRHRLRPLKIVAGTAATGTLPALTITDSQAGTAGLQFDYQGCIGNSFSLSCARKGWVQFTSSLVGNGVFRNSSSAKPSVVSEAYLKAGDIKVFIGTAANATPDQNKATADLTGTLYGSAMDFTAKLTEFNWSYNNNLLTDDGYGFNSGTIRDHMDKGRRSQTLNTTFELHDSGQISILESQKVAAVEFECANELLDGGAAYGFNLIFPKLIAENITTAGGPGDKKTVSIEWKVGEDTNRGSVMLDVYNTRTAYLQ